MDLYTRARNFLKDLGSKEAAFFFPSATISRAIIGSFRGQLICILVSEDGKINSREIWFCNRISSSGGEHHIIYSIDDLCEIAKLGGWHD